MMLPNYKVLDPRIDTTPWPDLLKMQETRLRAQVRYVYERTPFWRRKLDAAGVAPDDVRTLDDLRKVPFCTKRELEEDQAVHPPLGSYTASEPSTWTKFMTTSGTTGRPIRRVYSARDWGYAMDRMARQGAPGPGDILVILGPVDGLVGPTASMDLAARMGALVVCAGLYDTNTKIKLIGDLKPTAISGTPSGLLYLAEKAEEIGVSFADLGTIKSVTVVGEPGGAIEATRRRIAEKWGATVNDGYGLTEIFPLASGCKLTRSLHIAPDFAIAEVIDPITGEVLGAGRRGELVYTNIIGDTQTLLRYRSGDIGTLQYGEPCVCGSTRASIVNGIEGRVDDMIWYKGMNIFPSAIESAVRSFPELADEFRIVLNGDGVSQALAVQVELALPVGSAEVEGTVARLQERLKESTRVNAQIEVMPSGHFARAEYKSRRVIDNRGK